MTGFDGSTFSAAGSVAPGEAAPVTVGISCAHSRCARRLLEARRPARIDGSPSMLGSGAMLSLSPDGRFLLLPALTTAHSHAFQRGMRGAAQRPRASGRSATTSGRGAARCTGRRPRWIPESIERVSRVAFRELRRAGVRTVGEFHYVHHQPDGTPYDDRTVMSDAVIRAAKHEGLRVSLLRVAYHRAGPGRPAEAGAAALLRRLGRRRSSRCRRIACKVQGRPRRARRRRPSLRACRAEGVDRRARCLRRATRAPAAHARRRAAARGRRVRRGDRASAPSSSSPTSACSRSRSSRSTPRTSPPPRPSCSAARAPSPACARRPRPTSATVSPTSVRSAPRARASAPGSTATSSPTPSPTSARSRRSSGCGPVSASRSRLPGATPAEELWHSGSLAGAQACGFSDAGGMVSIPRDASHARARRRRAAPRRDRVQRQQRDVRRLVVARRARIQRA